jgi:DNA-binding transcriptional MerR regulator
VSQRCLDYWDEKGLVTPSVNVASGKGSERRYSFRDLLKLRVVRELRGAGLSLQKIQKAIRALSRRTDDPLADFRLITDGRRLHRVTDDPKVVEDVLSGGQMVFAVVAIGKLDAELRKRVAKLEDVSGRGARGVRRGVKAKRA